MRAIGFRRWRPRRTIRLRLTLLYGGLFLIAGAALLAITYGLVAGDSMSARPGSSSCHREVSRAGSCRRYRQALGQVATGSAVAGRPPKGASVIVQQKTPSGPVVDLRAYAGQVNAHVQDA